MSNVDILLNIFTSVGLDINKKDEYGNTPFMHAVMDGNIFLVSSLINFGIDVNIQNNDGKTPLMEVIESDFDTEDLEYWKIVMRIMLLLINAGANTNNSIVHIIEDNNKLIWLLAPALSLMADLLNPPPVT